MLELYIKPFLVAILEGLTEFVPVSSTGHMILFGDLIGFTGETAHSFEVFIQLGAILAALWVYQDKFIGLIPEKHPDQSFLKSLFHGDSKPTISHILLGILPILVGGFLLHSIIKEHLFSVVTVAIGLIVGGVMMILADLLIKKHPTQMVEDLTFKQAFWIGIGQCMALWPGMSRSGSTMVTGLVVGVKHKAAADYSFIIAVPVMAAAVGYDLLKSWHFLHVADIPVFLLGFVTAFIVALISIRWFLQVLTKLNLIPFGLYRIVVGLLTLGTTTL